MDKYILYTLTSKTEYTSQEEAEAAYNASPEYLKFLYQPDKIYFVGTISATGYIIGHDHGYHKDTAKCCGLFIADNKSQINTFLKNAHWKHQGASKGTSNARLYGNGPYGSLYRSDKDWKNFEWELLHSYLTPGNINYFHLLVPGHGAIDVKTARKSNPYRMY